MALLSTRFGPRSYSLPVMNEFVIYGTCSTLDATDCSKLSKLDEVVKELESAGKAERNENENTKGGRVVAITGDVSSEEDVKALIAKTVEIFGSLDIVSASTLPTSTDSMTGKMIFFF